MPRNPNRRPRNRRFRGQASPRRSKFRNWLSRHRKLLITLLPTLVIPILVGVYHLGYTVRANQDAEYRALVEPRFKELQVKLAEAKAQLTEYKNNQKKLEGNCQQQAQHLELEKKKGEFLRLLSSFQDALIASEHGPTDSSLRAKRIETGVALTQLIEDIKAQGQSGHIRVEEDTIKGRTILVYGIGQDYALWAIRRDWHEYFSGGGPHLCRRNGAYKSV